MRTGNVRALVGLMMVATMLFGGFGSAVNAQETPDPVQSTGAISIAAYDCTNIDEAVFDHGDPDDVDTTACEPGFASFVFYEVGDGTDDFVSLDVDGFGSMSLPIGQYEVYQAGLDREPVIVNVLGGDVNILVALNPVEDIQTPTPVPAETAVPTETSGEAETTPVPTAAADETAVVTALPSTGQGGSNSSTGMAIMLAASAAVIAGAGAFTLRGASSRQ